MHFYLSFVVSLTILGALVNTTLAITYKKLNDFPVSWFLRNTIKTEAELTNSCMLYSQGLSAKSRNLADRADPRLYAIWHLWPDANYDDSRDMSNEMRDIIVWIPNRVPDRNNPDKLIDIKTGTHVAQTYFERMSFAMAMLCSGQIVSIHTDVKTIPDRGIFRQVELETIKRKMEYAERMPNKAMRQVTRILGSNVNDCENFIDGSGRFPPVPPAQDLGKLPTNPPFITESPPGELLGPPIPNPRVTPRRSLAGRLLLKRNTGTVSSGTMEIYDSIDQYEVPRPVASLDEILGDETFEQLMEVLAELSR